MTALNTTRGVSRLAPIAALVLTALASQPVVAQSKRWTDLGLGTPGCCGVPVFEATTPRYGRSLHFHLSSARRNSQAWMILGVTRVDLPVLGGILVPDPSLLPAFPTVTDGSGRARITLRLPDLCPPPSVPLFAQALVYDTSAAMNFAFSNAISTTVVGDVDSDFNGDGYADLAIGVPGENSDAGAVNVAYGSAVGLTNAGTQILRQGADVNGTIQGTAEADDGFGTSLAVGDFDGDGYDDLAVGSPRESTAGPARTEAGNVIVIYGSAQGLQGGSVGRNDRLLRQGAGGVQGAPEDFDWFGKSMIAGDFDGDGCDDLAIGAPYENESQINSGVVHVLWGSSANGLTGDDDLMIEDPHVIEPDDRFGWNLATGDFNADGRYDIVVGRPYEDVSGERDAGAVSVLYMFDRAIASTENVHKNRTIDGVAITGNARMFDLFGFSLAVGDFNDDGVDDLGIGVPYDDADNNTVSAAGSVYTLYGSAGTGIVGAGNERWTQSSPGVLGIAQLGDTFGYALESGDFDADGAWDLAVGIPGDRVGGIQGGGTQVLYGVSGAGITAAGDQLWNQNVLGLNPAANDDAFGRSLFVGRFDGDCRHDLVFGVPGETVNGRADAGAVEVLYWGVVPNQFWSQVPLSGGPGTGDRFGAALSGSPDQRPL